ncbi:MAG TPA: dihydrofolate reductase family protein [Polyangiaceae bacterium]
MRKLSVFNQVTVDGYFVDMNGDMSWAHRDDPEWNAFVQDNASGGGTLLFGRHTYEMMVSFWPTPTAEQMAPVVAERMNALPKVVFSRTLENASWNNTKLVKNEIVAEVRKMKEEPGADLVIFGSGTIVAQFTDAGLIDEYQLVVNPLVLGGGKSMFHGVKTRQPLRRTKTRTFENGNVLLCYEPAR